jgi:hypothetical protein
VLHRYDQYITYHFSTVYRIPCRSWDPRDAPSGFITHVQALADRVPVQFRVTKDASTARVGVGPPDTVDEEHVTGRRGRLPYVPVSPATRRRPLDLRTAHGVFPALGLDVDYVQLKVVFLDDPIYSFVTCTPNGFPSFLP